MQWARHWSPTGWVPLETSRGRQYPHWTQYFLEQTCQMEDYAVRVHQGFPVGSQWCHWGNFGRVNVNVKCPWNISNRWRRRSRQGSLHLGFIRRGTIGSLGNGLDLLVRSIHTGINGCINASNNGICSGVNCDTRWRKRTSGSGTSVKVPMEARREDGGGSPHHWRTHCT